MRLPQFFRFCCFFLSIQQGLSQQVIPLYPGKAPGSETWTKPESADTLPEPNLIFVRNISTPTLTVYRPKNPTGTAIVVCPGGAFRFLSMLNEGTEVADWLMQKGVTVFLLKYRVVPTERGLDPNLMNDLRTHNFARIDSVNAPYVPLAVGDGREAVRYLRQHAAELGIDPGRIGMMGFSAGGTLVASVARTYDAGSRPDFVAPIYAYAGAILGNQVPADAPPMFLAMAADDYIANGNPALYEQWRDAGKPVEMHVYPTGGHGFGARRQYLPSDAWMKACEEWLEAQDLLVTPQAARFRMRYSLKDRTQWTENHEKLLHEDWAWLKRFEAENKSLAPPKPGEKRIVFMGNSITQAWLEIDSAFFKDKPYINRGISGQTTPQMLLRFTPDVVNLQPSVVVILAGTNDIAGNTGETSLETIVSNIGAMADLAKAHHIRVVISSVLPAFDYPWKPGMEPAGKIVRLNQMLRDYAQQNDCVWLDYFSAMADQRNGLPLAFSEDGVHPNLAGYKVMEPLVEAAIAKALKKK